ncbi:hypothetical protein ACIHEJ_25515 [Streptomyces sp. NPDC052301]|uniref:hypothetical protein n=1 Tax=Streptomyces sp. NPDC052301 TaxID=3365687 RepID=UPI0037CF1F18
MPADGPTEQQPGPTLSTAVSMQDLLAACAAAKAVSLPPRAPERPEGVQGHGPQSDDGPARRSPAAA